MERVYLLLLLPCILMVACRKKEIRVVPQVYQLNVPANFPLPVMDPENVLSADGVALGRMLFYDRRLSGNNKISCASCHQPALAFTDGVALGNAGFSGKQLIRSAPALINLAWSNNGLFWDGGATNLESQAFGPLTSEDEMFQNLAELLEELNQVPEYQRLFRKVFNDEIKTGYIVKALAQFQRTLISGNSRYDKYQGNEGETLNDQEKKGMKLFEMYCRSCHTGVLFTDNDFHNNGIDASFDNDALEGIYQGRFRISYNPGDLGKFKTPTLRNIALTAPYMHDGRFRTLEEVLKHYSSGIRVSATTDKKLMVNGSWGFALSDDEQAAVISFLQTLTDSSFINNQAFAAPAMP